MPTSTINNPIVANYLFQTILSVILDNPKKILSKGLYPTMPILVACRNHDYDEMSKNLFKYDRS